VPAQLSSQFESFSLLVGRTVVEISFSLSFKHFAASVPIKAVRR
jgi:hypothetical protein